MITLTEQYQHPLWQRKKHAIYERDGWTCRACKKDCYELSSQLHAHHLYRIKGLHVWEYDDESLVTLCASCHEKVSDLYKIGGIIAFKILCGEIDPIDLTVTKKKHELEKQKFYPRDGICDCTETRQSIWNDGILYCKDCKRQINDTIIEGPILESCFKTNVI
jgi:hypothetical protein